jgi:hypothetical protein
MGFNTLVVHVGGKFARNDTVLSTVRNAELLIGNLLPHQHCKLKQNVMLTRQDQQLD